MQKELRVQQRSRDIETPSDAELVRRFKMGDESAFSAIVMKYKERLFRVAAAMIGDESEAMDLSQDAFVKAYFNLKKFRGDSGLYTWLYRILYNLCISAHRRKKIISFISFEDRDGTKEFISNGPSPVDQYQRNEFKEALSLALEKLPPRQRMVFIMKQIDGMKHEEIANIIGVTEGAVKASYFQAVKKLQSLLREYGDYNGL